MKTSRRDFLIKTSLASAGLFAFPGQVLKAGNSSRAVSAYDVIVVGGGISGITATLAAARMGVSVVMLEQESSIGGAWTHELALAPRKGRVVGIFREIYESLNGKHSIDNLPDDISELIKTGRFRFFHKTAYTETLSDLLSKLRQVTVMTNTTVTNVTKTTENNRSRVTGVEAVTDGKVATISGKVIIDATGNSFVAYKAGCRTMTGTDSRHTHNEPYGPEIADEYGLINPGINILVERARAKAYFPFDSLQGSIYIDKTGLINSRNSNLLNQTEYGISLWTPAQQETTLKEAALSLPSIISQISPQIAILEKAGFTVELPSRPGAKISRRIAGEYILTADDIIRGNINENPVYINNTPLDRAEAPGIQTTQDEPKEYGIPFGCLIPVDTEGLLACGNSISGTYLAQTSYQAESAVCGISEAAGMAAAVACVYDLPIREVYDNNHFKCALFEQNLMPY